MFEREEHRKVFSLLSAFDSEKLARCKFLFGGGTRIVLELDECFQGLHLDEPAGILAGMERLRQEIPW